MNKNVLLGTLVGLALSAGAAFGQAPAAAPAPVFEVAAVKTAPPLNPALIMAGKLHLGMTIDGARVDIGSLSLADLIHIAYKVKAYQVTGPDWMGAQRFDILAKLPPGATKEQVPEMLQALLADRFKLTIHREKKDLAVYALVVGKGGSKLKESEPDAAPAEPPAPGAATGQLSISGNIQGKGIVVSGAPGQAAPMRMTMGENGTMRMESSKMSVAAIADMLSPMVDRPILDQTELKGNYQVTLELSLDDLRAMAKMSGMMPMGMGPGGGADVRRPADAASDPTGGSVFNTVQQMGLKLEPRKAPVDFIVIDHLEKAPTDN